MPDIPVMRNRWALLFQNRGGQIDFVDFDGTLSGEKGSSFGVYASARNGR